MDQITESHRSTPAAFGNSCVIFPECELKVSMYPWVRSTYPSFLDVMWSEKEKDFCLNGGKPTHIPTHTHTHRRLEAHCMHKTYMSGGTPTCPQVTSSHAPLQWSLILSPSYPEYPFITSACALNPAPSVWGQGPSASQITRRALSHSIRFHRGRVLSSRYRRQSRMGNAIYKAAGQDTTDWWPICVTKWPEV